MTIRTLSSHVLAVVVAACFGSVASAQYIEDNIVEKQNTAFKKWWDTDFEWRFDKLPTAVSVEESRIPYAGYIYPDRQGGTVNALRKYDQAFGLNGLTASYELRDVSQTDVIREPVRVMRGFGRFRRMVTRTRAQVGVPYWYGHCNGWSAAAIRHAEPQKAVVRNGVTFTPSDIKALLAEIYIYNKNEMLDTKWINPGTLHAIVTNWLGRGGHPIGMEADPGEEKWNYPVYAYKVNAYNRGPNYVDVEMTFTYSNNIEREQDKAPRKPAQKYFNYRLHLDENGKIVGGYYYRNSSQIDMMWIPVRPKKGGAEGNERGNPHIDIDEVLAIWRESVPAEMRRNWAHIDAVEQDVVAADAPLKFLRPAIVKAAPPTQESPASSNAVAASEE